jgi:hypothetical protein
MEGRTTIDMENTWEVNRHTGKIRASWKFPFNLPEKMHLLSFLSIT